MADNDPGFIAVSVALNAACRKWVKMRIYFSKSSQLLPITCSRISIFPTTNETSKVIKSLVSLSREVRGLPKQAHSYDQFYRSSYGFQTAEITVIIIRF